MSGFQLDLLPMIAGKTIKNQKVWSIRTPLLDTQPGMFLNLTSDILTEPPTPYWFFQQENQDTWKSCTHVTESELRLRYSLILRMFDGT